ncbi:transglycosylase SLT domain-containing protein [Halomonas sp. 18H]|nr:transglycosylase SLT domain-containing protein [Halomonas sp. 18H]MCW4151927.1 transglycosylase SLT domain-containing protein [Halomonas sp. 18H]
MPHHALRHPLSGLTGSCALMGAILTLGLLGQPVHASSGPAATAATLATDPIPADSAMPVSRSGFWSDLTLHPRDAWKRLRNNFAWQDQWREGAGHDRVQYWIEQYSAGPRNIAEITRRARPWLAWIIQQVEARGLPGEIALVPFVESSFDPQAMSHRGASGLWQIMPRTGEALGLTRSAGWDGRRDVVRSTQAALDYIEMQADQWYRGNIELSLAAYNAGAGTVNQARRVAQARGRSGDYWDLELPGETMDYVPKLLAIAAIIAEPEQYGIQLPDIHGGPAFASVAVTRRISLEEAARLTDVSRDTLSQLNPGLRQGIAEPHQQGDLLVPAGHASPLVAALQGSPDTSPASPETVHVVQRGETLSTIASQHAVAMNDLARWNDLDHPDTLQPGQQLTLSDG